MGHHCELFKKKRFEPPIGCYGFKFNQLVRLGIKREALLNAGIPNPISLLLIILALAISFVGGFTTSAIKRKEWFVITVFALLATIVLYLTIDLARPMEGLIKPDTGQQPLLIYVHSFN
jgi:hypothetical protein